MIRTVLKLALPSLNQWLLEITLNVPVTMASILSVQEKTKPLKRSGLNFEWDIIYASIEKVNRYAKISHFSRKKVRRKFPIFCFSFAWEKCENKCANFRRKKLQKIRKRHNWLWYGMMKLLMMSSQSKKILKVFFAQLIKYGFCKKNSWNFTKIIFAKTIFAKGIEFLP